MYEFVGENRQIHRKHCILTFTFRDQKELIVAYIKFVKKMSCVSIESFGYDDKEKQDTQINHFKFLKFPPFPNGQYMKVTFDTRTQLNNFEMNLNDLSTSLNNL